MFILSSSRVTSSILSFFVLNSELNYVSKFFITTKLEYLSSDILYFKVALFIGNIFYKILIFFLFTLKFVIIEISSTPLFKNKENRKYFQVNNTTLCKIPVNSLSRDVNDPEVNAFLIKFKNLFSFLFSKTNLTNCLTILDIYLYRSIHVNFYIF